jgi:putative solute:sodium symporter small subunit
VGWRIVRFRTRHEYGYSKWKRKIVQAAGWLGREFVVSNGKSMQLTESHKQYWHKNLKLTGALLIVWFVVTFVLGWFARDLQFVTFLGFPLSFFMGAQGAILIFVFLVWFYAYRMDRLDREFGVQEED